MRPVKQKHFRELLDPPNIVNDKYFITERYPQLFKICQASDVANLKISGIFW